MLQALRNRSGSLIVKTLLVLLMISFAVFFGVSDFGGGQNLGAVAEVGDVEIPARNLQHAVESELAILNQRVAQLPSFGGRPLTMTEAQDLGFLDPRQVLEREINDLLLDQHVRDMDLAVGPGAVADQIRSNPAFASATGQFDRFQYEQVIQQSGFNDAGYEDLVRRTMLREMVLLSAGSGVVAPDPVIKKAAGYREERRTAEVLRIPSDSFIDVGEPSEEDLKRVHETEAARFTAPEYRGIEVLHIGIADIAARKEIAEDVLREAYEDRSDEFSEPDRRRVTQYVGDKETADAISTAVKAGTPFADAVSAQGDGAFALELGWVERASVPPGLEALTETIFSLGAGETSAPVESTVFGWHVIHVQESEDGGTPAFAEVRETLREQIAREDAVTDAIELAEAMEDALAGGATFAEAGATIGIDPIKIDAVSRTGFDPDDSAVSGLPAEPRVLTTAFETPIGTESNLVETEEGGFFVVRVEDSQEATLRPFERVRDQVIDAWRELAQANAAETRASKIEAALASGSTLGEIATRYGLSVETPEPFLRSDGGQVRLPQSVVRDLFIASQGDVVMGPTADGHVVARLLDVVAPETAPLEAAMDQQRQRLLAGLQTDLQQQLLQALRSEIDVEIDEGILNAQFGGSGSHGGMGR